MSDNDISEDVTIPNFNQEGNVNDTLDNLAEIHGCPVIMPDYYLGRKTRGHMYYDPAVAKSIVAVSILDFFRKLTLEGHDKVIIAGLDSHDDPCIIDCQIVTISRPPKSRE